MSNVKRGIPRQTIKRLTLPKGDVYSTVEGVITDNGKATRTSTSALTSRDVFKNPGVGQPWQPKLIKLQNGAVIPWNCPTVYNRHLWKRTFIQHKGTVLDHPTRIITFDGAFGSSQRYEANTSYCKFGESITDGSFVRVSTVNGPDGRPFLTGEERNSFNVAFQNRFSDGAELIVSAYELKKSVHMLSQMCSSFTDVVRGLKSGNAKLLLRGLKTFNKDARSKSTSWRYSTPKSKDFSGRWLEFQYGIRPLLADIEGAYTAVSALAESYRLHRVRKSRKLQIDFKAGKTPYYNMVVHNNQLSISETHFYEWASDWSLLINKLGLLNVAGAAWDIIPYSLVVDWFLPVSSMLKQFTAYTGTNKPSGTGYQTRAIEISWSYYCRPSMQSKTLIHQYDGECFVSDRRVMNKWPVILPYLSNPFSSTRVISAISLLNQLRK